MQDPFLRGLLSVLLFCIYHQQLIIHQQPAGIALRSLRQRDDLDICHQPRSVFDPKRFLRRWVPVPILAMQEERTERIGRTGEEFPSK